MFKNSVELFNIFGFQVKVDASWLLIAALIVWNLSTTYFPEMLPGLGRYDYLALAVAGMLGLFGSLILHELSHSLVARYFGLRVGGITLFIFGGIAELEQEPKDPVSEFWIAIAGPAMSLALAGAGYVIAGVFQSGGGSMSLIALISYLALINLVLALFNLVPAFPLDGGRIFRALLWKNRNDLVSATRTASNFGMLFAIVLIGTGILSLSANLGIGGFWQILIGFFILSASRGSYQQLLVRQALADQKVRTLMTTELITVDPEETLETLVEQIMLKDNVSFVPVTEGDQVLGYVDTQIVQKIDREHWGSTSVGDIFVKADDTNAIPPEMATETVFGKMAASGQRKMLVVDGSRLVGVITLSDLLNFLAIRQGLSIGQHAGRKTGKTRADSPGAFAE